MKKKVSEDRSDVLKDFFPRSSCPCTEHGRSEYPRLSEESEKKSRRRRVEMKQLKRGVKELY